MFDSMTEKDFSLAVCDAVCRCTDMELDSCGDIVIIESYKHKQKMRKLLEKKSRIQTFNKRLAASCAAALMLWAGIAVYAHYLSGSYLIEITKGEYVEFAFRAGAERDKVLYERCFPSYVTEGFMFADYCENDRSISYVYESERGQRICFMQSCLGEAVLKLPYGYNSYDKLFVRGYKTWCFESNGIFYYLYNDGRFAYMLECDGMISREQARMMLDGFAPQ